MDDSRRAAAARVVGSIRDRRDLGVWVLRAMWVVLPLAVGPSLSTALDTRSAGVRTVASLLAWTGWTVTMVATLVPRTTSLTVLRIAVPSALATACWATGPSGDGEPGVGGVAAIVAAVVVGALVASPAVTDVFVNGSAYGAERRFNLRCPPLLVLLGGVVWLVVAAGLVTGPLLLGAHQWLAGSLALVVGLALAAAGARSLHTLARRWLVFVPRGLVIHDPVARPDAVMVPSAVIRRLAPALKDSDALDLTMGALGLALEMETTEPLAVTVRRRVRSMATQPVTRLLVGPNRPAAVLAEAESRRIPTA